MKTKLKYNYKFYQNKDCPFFPCHKIDNINDFNCLFCYCPLYSLGDKCGGNPKFLKDGTKDCSECTIPHERQKYNFIINKVNIIIDKIKINNSNYKINTILFATSNNNKIIEFKKIFNSCMPEIKILLLKDMEKKYKIPIETKSTYSENALLKAKYYAKKFNLITIADDSGLEVDCLNNFPGIKSQRWLSHLSQIEKNQKLITLINEKCKDNRDAKYIVKLALYDPVIKFKKIFHGELKGNIALKNELNPKHGFGYDAIFIVKRNNKLLSNLSLIIKNKISHRGIATLSLISWLKFFN